MEKKIFIEYCKGAGLTEGQSKRCYTLFTASDDIAWSFEKAKGAFNFEQQYQARLGFAHKLPVELVDIYFNPQFSGVQMEEGRLACEAGLSISSIVKFYQVDFSWDAMQLGRKFVDAIDGKLFSAIYNPEFSAAQMRIAFEECYKDIALNGLANPIDLSSLTAIYRKDYTPEQMKIAFDFYRMCGNVNDLDVFYFNTFSEQQMHEAATALWNGVDRTIVTLMCTAQLSSEQMRQIRIGATLGLTESQLRYLCNPELSADAMMIARFGLLTGLSTDEVSVFFREDYTKEQMNAILTGFTEGLSGDQISVIANRAFSWKQMLEGVEGFVNGLMTDQINLYYNTKFSSTQMKEIRKCIEAGVTEDRLNFLLETDLNDWQMSCASDALIKNMSIDDTIDLIGLAIDLDEDVETDVSDALLIEFFEKVSK